MADEGFGNAGLLNPPHLPSATVPPLPIR